MGQSTPETVQIESFTEREREILGCLAENLSNKEIAERFTLALSTVKWYLRQIYDKLGVSSRREAVGKAKRLGLLSQPGVKTGPPIHLPAQITPFIGRSNELEKVADLLNDATIRLITISGPGGIGKTCLAIESVRSCTQNLAETFSDGVFFVPLAPVTDPSDLPSAVARAIGFSFQRGEQNEQEQLFNYLHQKQMLLVLDNYEQLLTGSGWQFPGEVLAACPSVKLLITSRVQLGISGESVILLSGLPVPSWDSPDADIQKLLSDQSESLQLFERHAQGLVPGFRITAENVLPILRICHLVEGMPLAIELAAGWLQLLSPAEIADEITRNLDILQSSTSPTSDRQHSLRAVFDASWRLLTPVERSTMQRLAVFRGGFNRRASKEAAEVSVFTLRELIRKSWIFPEREGRFHIHELIRQYAQEMLLQDEKAWEAAQFQHSRYFLKQLEQRAEDWHTSRQVLWFHDLEQDIENINQAWQWALQHPNFPLQAAFDSLCRYYEWTGRDQAGWDLCRGATSQPAEEVPTGLHADRDLTCARAYVWWAYFTNDPVEADHLMNKANQLLLPLDQQAAAVQSTQALACLFEGNRALNTSLSVAWDMFQQAQQYFQRAGLIWGEAEALLGLGETAWQQGEYQNAENLIKRCLTLQEQKGNRRGIANALSDMALIFKHQQRLDEAERIHREIIAIYQEIGTRTGELDAHMTLSQTYAWQGKFTQAIVEAQMGIELSEKYGIEKFLEFIYFTMGDLNLHLGKYQLARSWLERGFSLSSTRENSFTLGFLLVDLGCLALLENQFDTAARLLEQVSKYHSMVGRNVLGTAEAYLAFINIKRGNTVQAMNHFCALLKDARQIHAYYPVMHALPFFVLMKLSQGDITGAALTYEVMESYPFITNSAFFQDLLLAELEPARLAAQGSDRASCQPFSLWELVDYLIADFCSTVG